MLLPFRSWPAAMSCSNSPVRPPGCTGIENWANASMIFGYATFPRTSTDIDENGIRAVALPTGLVDVKVCAVDAVWSGLKLVLRKELRPRPPPPLPRVARG